MAGLSVFNIPGRYFCCRTLFSDSCAEGYRHGMQCPVAELSLEVYPSTKDRNYRIIRLGWTMCTWKAVLQDLECNCCIFVLEKVAV